MSKQAKDQQVLLAILNVKKYAKNLRKKASNLQEPNEGPDVNLAGSSPSFFDHRQHEYLELNSPLLATKSSYNESFELMTRKKKQHSMTYLPGSKKVDRQSRKNSDFLVPEPLSPAKTYTHTIGRANLSQSYKMETNGLRTNKQGQRRKQQNEGGRQKFIPMQKRISNKKDMDSYSETNLQQFNQTMPVIKNSEVSPDCPKQSFQTKPVDWKLVQELLAEIGSLKNQLCGYKKMLILLRTRYLQMQEKCREKVSTDHLLDVFQQKIARLQSQKQKLNQAIKCQNKKIANFQSLIVEISHKFSLHFVEEINKTLSLKIENQVFRQLLSNKFQTRKELQLGDPFSAHRGVEMTEPDKKMDTYRSQSSDSSEDQSNINLRSISESPCKNQKDFKIKYDLKSSLI